MDDKCQMLKSATNILRLFYRLIIFLFLFIIVTSFGCATNALWIQKIKPGSGHVVEGEIKEIKFEGESINSLPRKYAITYHIKPNQFTFMHKQGTFMFDVDDRKQFFNEFWKLNFFMLKTEYYSPEEFVKSIEDAFAYQLKFSMPLVENPESGGIKSWVGNPLLDYKHKGEDIYIIIVLKKDFDPRYGPSRITKQKLLKEYPFISEERVKDDNVFYVLTAGSSKHFKYSSEPELSGYIPIKLPLEPLPLYICDAKQYEVPLLLRIIGTPVTIVIDIVTSPFQLLFFSLSPK